MANAIYLATILSAAGLYLLMPSRRRKPTIAGAILAAGALVGLLGYLLNQAGDNRPVIYYYLFTAIALVAAVRVITHKRPVYSALYFVVVVLAVAGLFLLLEAQFMAFAMVIIYAGAILVTYLFVIMLATLPQSSIGEDTSPLYDRTARQPLLAVVMGFALLALLLNVIFTSGPIDPGNKAASDLRTAIDTMPGRAIKVLSRTEQLQGVKDLQNLVLDQDEGTIQYIADGKNGSIALDDDLRAQLSIGNIEQVGLNLFESHTLGIELAGVILLLSMVGAIVIAKKIVVAESTEPRTPKPEP